VVNSLVHKHYLGISRKRASTTAYQPSLPINLAKRDSFWNDPYPFGIAGTSRVTIIDWDEAALFVESTNRGYGKCYLTTRATEEGPYNNSEKHTITCAIRGGAIGGIWIQMEVKSGTTVMDTYNFIDSIITGPNGLGQGGINARGVNNTPTFICDNLLAHKKPLIRHLIEGHEHQLLFRAPYYPVATHTRTL
jgi:hypothetical protein